MKTILLLDIDGTVNAEGADAWDDWIEGHATDDHGVTWAVRAAVPVVQFFTELHQSGLVEIRWHTAWQHAAADFGSVVGLPRFPLQQCDPCGPIRRHADWKLEAVRYLINLGHRVIWVDDDVRRLPDLPGSLDENLFIMTVDPKLGLTKDKLELLNELVIDCAS